nr:hypothetical protein [Eubacterium sp.]
VNELSYIILEAERSVNMVSDDIVVRVSDNSPEDYLTLACEVARDGGGKLKFVGDKTIISNLMLDGMPLEKARCYGIQGCTSPIVEGYSYNLPGGIISLPGILELALNNGIHRLTGLRLGLETGDARNFSSYEEVVEAFKKQVEYVVPFLHQIKNADKEVYATYMPSPFQSCMVAPCIESGKDVISGGTKPYYFFAMSTAGAPNVGDSLAAIKKIVFEDEMVTMGELMDAIEHNWEGYEQMQKLFIRAPKFGNDDPYVDGIVNSVLSFVSDEICKYEGYNGAHSQIAAAAVTANVGLGMVCGALPDGRCAGEPISEGGISPAQGRNESGITATMMSIAHLDHTKMRHGSVLNIRMNPDSVDTSAKIEKFKSLIKSFCSEGGFLVQFNIVSTKTLRDAQVNPEAHRDLVVRVATYAAYFVELGKELQDDIIHRLEMQEC